MLQKWDDLPAFMKNPEVRPYWESLNRKKGRILLKRCADLLLGIVLLILLAIPMCVIGIWIRLDSEGSALYRQERVTTNGKRFRIHKFRTMISDADKIGTAVTVGGDRRITRIGEKLRRYRLDELPQLIDVITGDMSFVGTRPEATKYVDQYQPEWFSTLLMPAGITSEASIRYKDEDKLLKAADDVDKVYMEQILPAKMEWNLDSVKRFSVWHDFGTMIRTVLAVLGKTY